MLRIVTWSLFLYSYLKAVHRELKLNLIEDLHLFSKTVLVTLGNLLTLGEKNSSAKFLYSYNLLLRRHKQTVQAEAYEASLSSVLLDSIHKT